MRVLALAFCAGAMMPVAGAQAQGVSAEDMRAAENAIPDRDYYPEGYYDVRVAAEATIAKWPRERDEMLGDCLGGSGYGGGSANGGEFDYGRSRVSGRCYEVLDCAWQPVPVDEDDPAFARFGPIALEIARLRSELDLLGYPRRVYAQAIGTFEQRMLTGDALTDEEAADKARERLVRALERRRLSQARDLQPIINEKPCGPLPDGPIVVRTVPDGGEVLLINAFAFNVCTRRQPDPWDRFACRWNEWVPGEARSRPYGRFMYQVSWPDGANRRGTREIARAMNEETVTVTFRK